ncbi:MAG: mandelate racemase/muconate lactonizing enzyme family protein [Phycisphaerae bacterium]
MKIADIRVLGPKNGYLSYVEVESDDGLVGIGSTSAPAVIVKPIIEHGDPSLRSLIVGEDPCDPLRLWKKMFIQWQARCGRGSEGGLAVNTMSAIDMALWDLAGKAQGKPVYQLLGGAVQRQVMAYASATLFTVESEARPDYSCWVKKTKEQLVHECRWCLDQGFKAIKYGWGNYFAREDEENLAAIRETIGPHTRLMMDFGSPPYWTEGWNAQKAIHAAQILEKYDVYFFEEALPPHDVNGFRELSEAVAIKIASGESLTTTYQFNSFIECHALDIVQPDAAQMGITQFHEVAQQAGNAGILCVPHGPWTAMTVASHIQLLATLKNGDMIEYPCMESLGGSKRLYDEIWLNNYEIVEYPPVLKDGYLQLSDSPGLGVGNFVHTAIKKLDRFYPGKKVCRRRK